MDAGPVLYLSRGPGPFAPGPGKVREHAVEQSVAKAARLRQRDAWCWPGCMYKRCRYSLMLMLMLMLTSMLPYGVTVIRLSGSRAEQFRGDGDCCRTLGLFDVHHDGPNNVLDLFKASN